MSHELVQKCYSYVIRFTFIHKKKKELLTPTESGNFKIVQDSESLTTS